VLPELVVKVPPRGLGRDGVSDRLRGTGGGGTKKSLARGPALAGAAELGVGGGTAPGGSAELAEAQREDGRSFQAALR
jgi:hypothetical protein